MTVKFLIPPRDHCFVKWRLWQLAKDQWLKRNKQVPNPIHSSMHHSPIITNKCLRLTQLRSDAHSNVHLVHLDKFQQGTHLNLLNVWRQASARLTCPVVNNCLHKPQILFLKKICIFFCRFLSVCIEALLGSSNSPEIPLFSGGKNGKIIIFNFFYWLN